MKKKISNFLSEAFVWMLLSTITEVWVTATVERISMGDKYIMNEVPFWSLQGHTTMWQWTVGLGLTIGLRLLFYYYDKFEKEIKVFRNLYFRALITMMIIYVVEYIAGLFFNKLLGFELWDYSQYTWHGIPLHLQGQITLVYAPFWYIAGLLVRPIYRAVHGVAPYMSSSIRSFIEDIPDHLKEDLS